VTIHSLRTVDPVNARAYELEAPFSERRYEYLVQRRDELSDKIRTGSLALNGSSLVAMLAALSGEGKAAQWIGLTPDNTALTAAFFVVGAAASGAAIIVANGLFATEASDAFDRMLKARQVLSIYDAEDSQQSRDASLRALQDFHAAPLVDFQYSRASIAAQSSGAGLWLAGMCIPLLTAAGADGAVERAWAWLKGIGAAVF